MALASRLALLLTPMPSPAFPSFWTGLPGYREPFAHQDLADVAAAHVDPRQRSPIAVLSMALAASCCYYPRSSAIRNPGREEPLDAPDSLLDPDAIARTYLHLLQQDRSAWTWEVELRPWVERF